MKINDTSELNSIISEIHDLWFDVEQVKNNYSDNSVKFGLASNSSDLKEKKIEKTLKVNNVANLEINDTEQVGYYDVNELIYDKDNKTVTVTTGVPIQIKIQVNDFELELE